MQKMHAWSGKHACDIHESMHDTKSVLLMPRNKDLCAVGTGALRHLWWIVFGFLLVTSTDIVKHLYRQRHPSACLSYAAHKQPDIFSPVSA